MTILTFFGVSSLLELATYLILIIGGIIFILNNKTSIFKGKYETLVEIAKVAVGAAEQLSIKNNWTGPEKFKYVYDILLKYSKGMTEDEITALIEDAVYRLTGTKKTLDEFLQNHLLIREKI